MNMFVIQILGLVALCLGVSSNPTTQALNGDHDSPMEAHEQSELMNSFGNLESSLQSGQNTERQKREGADPMNQMMEMGKEIMKSMQTMAEAMSTMSNMAKDAAKKFSAGGMDSMTKMTGMMG